MTFHNLIDCKTIKRASEIYKLSKTCRVVGIDEAQFFDDEIVEKDTEKPFAPDGDLRITEITHEQVTVTFVESSNSPG